MADGSVVTLEEVLTYLREDFALAVKGTQDQWRTTSERMLLRMEAVTLAGVWFFMLNGRKCAAEGPDPEFDAFYAARFGEVLDS